MLTELATTAEFIETDRAIFTDTKLEEVFDSPQIFDRALIWQKVLEVKEQLFLSDANLDFIRKQLDALFEMREKLASCETILLPSVGGIGDMIQRSRCALALAKRFPQAKVYIEERAGELERSVDAPPNLEVINRGDRVNLRSPLSEVAVISFDYFGTIEDDWLKRKFSLWNSFGYKPKKLHILDCPNHEGYIGLWDLWRYIINPEVNPLTHSLVLADEVDPGKSRSRDIPFPIRQQSRHITTDLASKLANLGVSLDSEFMVGSQIFMPERTEAPMSDITIVYDSASLIGDKNLSPGQLREIIAALRAEFPDITITIVKGKSHPEVAIELFEQFEDIVLFESDDYREVMKLLANSRVVFTGDTGFTHHLNEYRRIMHHKYGVEWDSLPRLIQYIGIGPTFPVNHYRADCADTGIIVKDYVDEVPPEIYIDAIKGIFRQPS